MQKYVNSKNISDILNYLYHDTCKSIRQHYIFRNRISRRIFICCLIILYILYFYWNMVALSNLSRNVYDLELSEHIRLGKITLSSYYNSIGILGVFIAIFIRTTFHLTNRTLYLLKMLPFHEMEVQIGVELFRLSMAFFILEIVLIIVAPALKLIPMDQCTAILILLSLHFIFLATFMLTDFLYHIILKKVIHKNISKFCLDLTVIFFTIWYYTSTKFKIDIIVGELPYQILELGGMILALSIVIVFIILYFGKCDFLSSDMYLETRFFNIGFHHLYKYNGYLSTVFHAMIRCKNFSYLLFMLLMIIGVYSIQNTLQEIVQPLLFIFPLISLGAISYADSTHSFRRMHHFYHITTFEELKCILMITILLTSPSAFISWLAMSNLDSYFYSISIMISAIMVGFLFPKTKSIINESISVILSITVVVLLTLIANVKWALLPTMIMFILLLYVIIDKENKMSL